MRGARTLAPLQPPTHDLEVESWPWLFLTRARRLAGGAAGWHRARMLGSLRGPDGVAWRVRHRWLPWSPRRRLRGRTVRESFDLADDRTGCGAVFLITTLLPVIVLVVILVIEWVAALAFVIEWIAALAALPILAIFRTFFGVPWVVTARPRGVAWPTPGMAPVEALYLGSVHGWGRSRALIVTVRREIGQDGVPVSLSPWRPARRRRLSKWATRRSM